MVLVVGVESLCVLVILSASGLSAAANVSLFLVNVFAIFITPVATFF